jgi:DNA invertase Pin-like site-specific DNA recombinase
LLRVSTQAVEQSESPEAQRLYIQEEIRRASLGSEIWIDTNLVYADEITGAMVLDREGVKQLLIDARAGKFDLLCMKSIQRLGRDTLGLLHLKRQLDDYGIELVALQDGYRSRRDPELIFLVHADRAQAGREDISRNVRNGMRQRARQGKWVNGSVPFGLRRKNRNELEPHPETAPIAVDIFKLRREGWGTHRITKYLNQNQIPSASWWAARGRLPRLETLAATDDRYAEKLAACRSVIDQRPAWSPRALSAMLTNPAYYGELRYYRRYYRVRIGGKKVLERRPAADWISIPCPALLSREEWEEAQESILRGRQTGTRERTGSHVYLLTGLLRCGTCGARMNGHSARGTSGDWYGYYSCFDRRMKHICSQKSARSDTLEAAVIEALKAALAIKPAQPVREPHPVVAVAVTQQLEAQLADLADQRRYYRNEHRRNRLPDDELDVELARIATEENALRIDLETARNQAEYPERLRRDRGQRQELVEKFGRWTADSAEAERPHTRALIQIAVDHITYRGPDDFDLALRFPAQ